MGDGCWVLGDDGMPSWVLGGNFWVLGV